jgi:hypothetical protein
MKLIETGLRRIKLSAAVPYLVLVRHGADYCRVSRIPVQTLDMVPRAGVSRIPVQTLDAVRLHKRQFVSQLNAGCRGHDLALACSGRTRVVEHLSRVATGTRYGTAAENFIPLSGASSVYIAESRSIGRLPLSQANMFGLDRKSLSVTDGK